MKPSLLFFKRVRSLIRHPIFYGLTIIGNAMMVLAAFTFYYLEKDLNPSVKSLLDGFWWAVSIVTSVGAGTVVPVTIAGRCLGIGMMIFGVALFSSFTALFAAQILAPEIKEIEGEEDRLERMIQSLESALTEVRSLKGKSKV